MDGLELCTLLSSGGCITSNVCCINGSLSSEISINKQCICAVLGLACQAWQDACSPGCVGFGTKILMADGSHKNAEDIKVGDVLLSVDFIQNPSSDDIMGNSSCLLRSEYWRYSTTTVKNIKFGFEKEYYVINNKLRLTYEHPVLVDHENRIFFKSASILTGQEKAYNDRLEDINVTINKVDKALATIRINTEDLDWFFADGILVHNGELIADIGMQVDPMGNEISGFVDGGGPTPESSSSSSGPGPKNIVGGGGANAQ